jgi:hypothetical protein
MLQDGNQTEPENNNFICAVYRAVGDPRGYLGVISDREGAYLLPT